MEWTASNIVCHVTLKYVLVLIVKIDFESLLSNPYMIVLFRVMALPSTVIYFTLYDYLKYKVGFREGDPATKYIPLVMAPSARRKLL